MRLSFRSALPALGGALLGGVALAQAAVPSIHGSGVVTARSGSVEFYVYQDEETPFYLEYRDHADQPARTFVLGSNASVDCLGKLFGGRAARVSGAGWDSVAPGDGTDLQVFLVDGAGGGPDRISMKVTRGSGAVAYFTPMRDVDRGDLFVGCPD